MTVQLLPLVMIRHGESINNYRQSKSWCGYERIPDAPLTRLGRRQAEESAARVLRAICHDGKSISNNSIEIYTSDMTRAIETGMYIAKGLKTLLLPRQIEVCIVPLPFCNEIGARNVETPSLDRFKKTMDATGCHLDASHFAAYWDESQTLVGNFASSHARFRELVLPWLKRRHVDTGTCLPLLVNHGLVMRRVVGTLKYFRNTDIVPHVFDV